MTCKPRFLVVLGTRPEAIKMASLVRRLREDPAFEVRICVTAQHRELLNQGVAPFDIRPDYDLRVMQPHQSLNGLTGAVLDKLEEILADWPPDRVIVHGDTTTAFSGALAAFHRRIPVAHVEAGLRTDDAYTPWPEEMNRRFIDRIAETHFAPTRLAAHNLLSEGAEPSRIVVTGNTVIDALLETNRALDDNPDFARKLAARYPFLDDRRLVLVTGHRRENFGDGLENICRALIKLAERGDVQIVYPLHLNPNVQDPVTRTLGEQEAIHLISPQDYPHFVYLMRGSHFIITDSGGIQEEGPAIGKPVLVTRANTERPEAVNAGTSQVVGLDPERIVSEAERLLDEPSHYRRMVATDRLYGDGSAAARIVNAFKDLYAVSKPATVQSLAPARPS